MDLRQEGNPAHRTSGGPHAIHGAARAVQALVDGLPLCVRSTPPPPFEPSRPSAAIPLCVSYAEYLIGNYYTAQGLSAPAVATDEDEVMEDVERKVGEPDQVLGAAFSLEAVRDGRRETLANGGGHLAEVS